ncbi:2-hydroxychromene-2-carboxylate isomerase [Nisaea acidiphila]|uniref:2-hydroxychromene-2-carboxylate isomerase n=1 Tax=Nisaea acidiphila TaxID=1862145 RepID=A0A9J7AN19_9PROT|nr:2-hydroxychromene-2-carboxylate isomerase [Nisaea acidiphila]UUX48575.1 2-hydroxychromene-2-carboxylate isomerase [Nisaea acidiphila]
MTTIEYFYAAYSGYAYIGSALFREIAAEAGATVVHRPFQLRTLVAARGNAERVLDPVYRNYAFRREIERWAEYRAVRTLGHGPTHHQKSYETANRMLIAAGETGSGTDDLAHAFLEAHWADDADLSDTGTLTALADAVGLDGAALLRAAATPDVGARHEENTEEAIRRGFFGSPTYVVDGDPFYGQDRLELVARALERPFADKWAPLA